MTDPEALETLTLVSHLPASQCLVSLESQSVHPAPCRVSDDHLTQTRTDAHPLDSPEPPARITEVKVSAYCSGLPGLLQLGTLIVFSSVSMPSLGGASYLTTKLLT